MTSEGGHAMFWIGILAIVLTVVLGSFYIGSASALLKPYNLFLFCIIVFPLLLASGQFGYFILGLKIAAGRVKRAPPDEVKKVILALKLTVRLTLLSGFIGFIIGGIAVLSNLSTASSIGNAVALGVLSLLYTLVFMCFLVPVQTKAEAFLIDMTRAQQDATPASGADDEK